jgi:hypothetical protein
MLAFYGDGSGEHGKGPMIVAGYLADTLDWFEIERAWCRELDTPPRVDYFKASQCMALSGQFDGWDRAAADEKRLKLAEIVRRHNHRIVEISSLIEWDDYRYVIGDGVTKSVYYHPYFFCFHGVASLCVEASGKKFRPFRGRVASVLDTETYKTLDLDVRREYDLARENLPPDIAAKMGSVTWDTDFKLPLLQVADLIAWCIRADHVGLPSHVLNVLRDEGRLAGQYARNWLREPLARFIANLEIKVKDIK